MRITTARGRLLGLIAILVVLLAADAAVAAFAVRSRDHAVQSAQRLQHVGADARSLGTALVDQETGERGYLITGQESFLQPYRQGQREAAALFARLHRDLQGSSALDAQLAQVERAVARWTADAAVPEIQAVRAGDATRARALVLAGTGKERFDALRADLDRFQRALDASVTEANNDATGTVGTITITVIASFVLALGVLAVSSMLLRAWVFRPLGQINDAVEQVASGSVEHSVPAPSPDEFARLGANVDRMRIRMIADAFEAIRARQALAEGDLAAVTLADELRAEPVETPPGIVVAARLVPAEGLLAGDWYEVMRLGDERLAVVVVDVVGHGTVAAMTALRAKQLLSIALRDLADPADGITWVAERLRTHGDVFLSCLVVVLDLGTATCRYANAGHPAAVLLDGRDRTLLAATGPIVSHMIDGRWSSRTEPLGGESNLVAYSDGLVEARNGDGEFYGLERVLAHVESAAEPGEAVDDCLADVATFHGGPPRDDVTLVVVRTDVRATLGWGHVDVRDT
jgi:sigma-B regulation protein RsbU (phosphoserine phosphatase)